MADEHASKEESQGPGDSSKSKGGFSFVPRWRKHAASQVQPIDTPSVAPEPAAGTSPGVHPNLQKQPEAGESGKKFQPRWRQRAAEIEAQKTAPEPAWQQEVPQPQPPPEKAGFQPRWRRTAAPNPTPEAPLEPQPKEEKSFQPKWRQRAERPAAPSPPPRAEFTPRWKRNLAEGEPAPTEVVPASPMAAPEAPALLTEAESLPVEATTLQAEVPTLQAESPTVQPEVDLPAVAPAEIGANQGFDKSFAQANLELTGSEHEVSLVGAASPALAEGDSDQWFGGPAPGIAEALSQALEFQAEPEPAPPETSVAPVALAAAIPLALSPEPREIEWPEAAVEEVEGETLEPTPVAAPVNEKRKLPRPQPPPPPKTVEPPEAIPTPDTEGGLRPLTDTPVSGPKASLLKFLPSPEDEVLAQHTPEPEPQPEAPAPEKKVIKRLDDEAMAALKATASMLTAPNRMTPPPPPPPPPVPAATTSAPAPPGPAVSEPPRPAPSQARYVPTPVIKPSRPPAGPTPQTAAPQKPKVPRREPVISTEEVATFTRQFSVMVGAGLPIHQALSFLAESNLGSLGKVVDQVATKISSGLRLSVALSHFPGVFSEVYLGLIELGETSSHIDEALGKLADLLEKQVRLAKRLQSAMIYPAFLIAASMGAVGVFLQYVLPTMIPLFQSFSMTLPWPTRVLLYSRHLVWPTVITVLSLVAIWRWFQPAWIRARRRKEPWARKVDAAMMKIPLFGKLIQQIAVARVLFALATMIETGLPILNALHRCESVASNLEFAVRLEKAGEELRDGSTVTDALALYEVLPASCIHLISAGEESAQMAEMVQYAARYYEEEVDHSINQFMNLVEPVIMCVMGIVVAFIVLSAVLPTVEMINHLGG